MTRAALEAADPELARHGRKLLEDARVGLLGTIRRDGSPRISPVGPYIASGRLVIGVMTRSAKARDLEHDPRCAYHSAVSAPDKGVPELKLHGRVQPLSNRRAGWWTGRPLEDARVYELAIEEAVLVEWDLAAGRMSLRRWSETGGATSVERPYP